MELLLDQEVETIAQTYFIALYKSKAKSSLDYALIFKLLFVWKVNNAFSYLSKEEKQMINNEFFYEQYPLWWKRQYSEKTFLTLKRKAVLNFLKYYRSANEIF